MSVSLMSSKLFGGKNRIDAGGNGLIHGTRAVDNDIIGFDPYSPIKLSGNFKGEKRSFSISEDVLRTHLLIMGMIQRGKTNVIMEIARQLKAKIRDEDVIIIFDTKQDFIRELGCGRNDAIVSASGFDSTDLKRFNRYFKTWNIFREVTLNGTSCEKVLMLSQEICHDLFDDKTASSMPYFANAARSVTAAYLTAAVLNHSKARTNEGEGGTLDFLDNGVFKNDLSTAGYEEFSKVADMNSELRYVRRIIDETMTNDARGVLSEVATALNDCFTGEFSKRGDFSFGEFIRNAGGRTLYIEYDMSIGETLCPMYKMFFDIVLREAMGTRSTGGKVYVILDEIRLLPKLRHLNDALNFGASKGIRLIAGCQSVAQLEEAYGKSGKNSTVAGFGSLISFYPNDAASSEYVRSAFGKNMYAELINDNGVIKSEPKERYVIEDWELKELGLGEAIVRLNGGLPFKFKFDRYGK